MRQYAELLIHLYGIMRNYYKRICGSMRNCRYAIRHYTESPSMYIQEYADLQRQWNSSGWGIACDYVILCENQPPYAITDKHDEEHLYSISLQKAKTWNDALLHFITYAYLSISSD